MNTQLRTLSPSQLAWCRANMPAFAEMEAISQRVQRETEQSRGTQEEPRPRQRRGNMRSAA